MDALKAPSRTRPLVDEEESYSRNMHRRLVESASSIPQYTPRKPLIDQCTNEWQHSTKWKGQRSSSPDGFDDALRSFFHRCLAILKAPKIRRHLLLYTVILLFSIWLLTSKIWPVWEEQRILARSLSAQNRRLSGGLFGSNLRPTFPNMIQVKDLDPKFVPSEATATEHATAGNVNRLIFVGDIHGCLDELKALLEKVRFDTKTDHLIATGDIIAKGPDSGGAVDFLHDIGASCVRGNHEDRILLMAHDLKTSPLKVEKPDSSPARTLAASLTPSQIAYLESCPVILRVGFLEPLAGDLAVVHAGLVPGIPLERQDPTSAMNMRSIHLNTHVPSKEPNPEGSVHWIKLWNKYQQSLPTQWSVFPSRKSKVQSAKQKHTTVVYGHDAPRGLQLKRYSKGIDTGCVKGGKLTALVLGAAGSWQTVQVQCKDYRKRRPLNVEVEDVLRDGKLGKSEDRRDE